MENKHSTTSIPITGNSQTIQAEALKKYEKLYAHVEATEGTYSRKAMTLHSVISGIQDRIDQEDWGGI